MQWILLRHLEVFCSSITWARFRFSLPQVLLTLQKEPDPAGRHTEGMWSLGRRKRSTQPGWIRKGGIPWTYNKKNLLAPSTRWTPRPTSTLHFTSLMDLDPSLNKKRTELGPWVRLNKRNADQSPSSSETHPFIRIIRATNDPKPWEELSGLGLSFEAGLPPCSRSNHQI